MNQTGWTAENLLLRTQDGNVYPVSETTLIGREADCQIVLNHPRISRHHACIHRQDGQWLVEDLCSGNGTFVNGRRLDAPHILNPGDELRLDDIVLQLATYGGDNADAMVRATRPDNLDDVDSSQPPRTLQDTTFVLRSDETALMNSMTRREVGFIRPGAPLGPGLVVLSAPIRGKVLPLRASTPDASWLIGRDPDAAVHLIDRAVSQQHARIHRHDGHWSIENLSVTNPLFVNGEEIGASKILSSGDRIQLGRSEMQFHTDCSNLATLPPATPRIASGRAFLISAAVILGTALAGLALFALLS